MPKKANKVHVYEKTQEFFKKYKNILIAEVESCKGDLPKHLPKKALDEFVEAMPGIHLLLIFTNKDIAEISNITAKYIIEKQAKPGQLSPVEIIIPAGPTGMDSSQIDYFQALKIPTKVSRNQLEITTATKILHVGQKITLKFYTWDKR